VLTRLEDVGGELNAYTTKEETAIHASFLSQDYPRALELIADVAFNSVFPEKEIVKEKDVIIEEINSYLDNPAELIFDEFEELIYPGQAIGRNILGTVESVKSFDRASIASFIGSNYSPGQIVVCSVGDIPEKKLIREFARSFSDAKVPSGSERKNGRWTYRASNKTKKMDTFQNHCIIGNKAYDMKDSRRVGMFVLNNILGGQGSNSRLNMSLRERNGLAYNVESGYNPYIDTGFFFIYFGTDGKQLDRSISITMNELKKLRNKPLSTVQMNKACNQIKGYLARGYENHESLMLSLGKSMLVFNRIDTYREICEKIDKITSADLMEIAAEVFDEKQLSTLIYE
jgi:predicted Zn-dependent peptidase